jgi:hypothetical protein
MRSRFNRALKLTIEEFPELPFISKPTPVIKNDWAAIINKDSTPEQHQIIDDIFEGEVDENHVPVYGKITFANGNIYTGPIFTSFPKDDEDIEDVDDQYDENNEFEYYERDPYANYGEMLYPDGSSFWGVFCFGERTIASLKK